MFCKRCKYDLRELGNNRCPECGRFFDAGNPRTYLTSLSPWWRRHPIVWFVVRWNGFGAAIIGPVFVVLGTLSLFQPIRRMSLFGEPVNTTSQKVIWIGISTIITVLGFLFVRWFSGQRNARNPGD